MKTIGVSPLQLGHPIPTQPIGTIRSAGRSSASVQTPLHPQVPRFGLWKLSGTFGFFSKLGERFRDIYDEAKFYFPIATSLLMVSYVARGEEAIRKWETSAIFQPSRCTPLAKLTSPDIQAGVRAGHYRSYTFPSLDGTQLKGWHFPAPATSKKETVVFAHGNKGAMSDWEPTIEALIKAGYGVFSFDYRGYGGSRGQATEEGVYQDFIAASKFVSDKLLHPVPITQQIAMGDSLGGAVVIGAISQQIRKSPSEPMPFKAIVLSSTFTSIPNVLSAMKKRFYIPQSWLPLENKIMQRFNSIEKIQDIQVPILFVHSKKDNDVPFRMQGELMNQVTPGVRIDKYLLEDSDHSCAKYRAEPIVGKIDEFLGYKSST
jgi:fermentation-respiration switch protein FrsA (DUF1100 family)